MGASVELSQGRMPPRSRRARAEVAECVRFDEVIATPGITDLVTCYLVYLLFSPH